MRCAPSTRRRVCPTISRTRWRYERWISSACWWQPLLPRAQLLTRLVAPRALGVLVAAPAFAGRADIPESWTVTSDSLAVLAAAAIGGEEAVLLKPVAGVVPRWPSDDPPLAEMTADELQALQDAGGGLAVDPYPAEAVRRTGVAVVVRTPGASRTVETRIVPG